MKNETLVRDTLIENTIYLIAEGGFEKATTREIAHCRGHLPDVRMNESYIYRLFGGKENLYAEAFSRLNREMTTAAQKAIADFCHSDYPLKKNAYQMLHGLWRFMLRNEARCRCFVRYYYSVYFTGESKRQHQTEFVKCVSTFSHMFKEDANVVALTHSVFTTMLDFAVRVYNGELEDDEENEQHIFNVIFNSLADYLIGGEESRVGEALI